MNGGALIVLSAGLSAASAQSLGVTNSFRPEKLAGMDAAINEAVAQKQIPGGVLWLERGGAAYHKAFGKRALVPAEEPMTEDTIFDAASLTKVMATTPAVMLLVERGKIGLDEPARTYLMEFKSDGKDKITIRQLLTHTSGLHAGLPLRSDWTGSAKAIELACAERPVSAADKSFRYSDVDFIVLGEIVQRVSGERLDEFAAREIFNPLKLADTGFQPPAARLSRIAPTEQIKGGEVLRGKVHDPTARRMGGVAGHAGLFTTAADLARFARMMLNGGALDGARILKPETVKAMTSVQTPKTIPTQRGLGWDIDSDYSGPRGKIFPIGSYGHTGWTGTSVWIDPFSRTFVIFLSNRNHPDERGNVAALRARLGTLAAEAGK